MDVRGGGELAIEVPVSVRSLFVAAEWHPGRADDPRAYFTVRPWNCSERGSGKIVAAKSLVGLGFCGAR